MLLSHGESEPKGAVGDSPLPCFALRRDERVGAVSQGTAIILLCLSLAQFSEAAQDLMGGVRVCVCCLVHLNIEWQKNCHHGKYGLNMAKSRLLSVSRYSPWDPQRATFWVVPPAQRSAVYNSVFCH